MGLENLSDGLKTSPISAPASLLGVRNQLRFWGMGAGASVGNSSGLPDLQSRMGTYSLDAAQSLAETQRRASELAIGAMQADVAVKAGVAEDNSNIAHEKFDNQKPSILDMTGKVLAVTSLVGNAAYGIAEKLGSDKMMNILKKIPTVGPTKESLKVKGIYDEIVNAYEKKDLLHAEDVTVVAEASAPLISKYLNFTKVGGSVKISSADLDSFLPDAASYSNLMSLIRGFSSY